MSQAVAQLSYRRDSAFKAHSIANAGSGATVLDVGRPGRPPQVPPEVRRAQLQPLQRSGTIVSVLYAPHGEIRGAILDDGSQLRLPKRAVAGVQPLLQTGNRVQVSGYGSSNAFGTCIEPIALGVNGAPVIRLYGAR